MNEYNIAADFLNKFSQLTPWVQALIGLGLCGVLIGASYFIKEMVAVIMRPFCKVSAEKKAPEDDNIPPKM